MDITALQRSWRDVDKVGDEAIQFFYSHLFLAQPQLRQLFPISMSSQRDKFFAALGRIVSNIDRLSADTTFVEQLGRDHRRFEVVSAHYPLVGPSLLATLQHFLGAAWTEQLAADWAEAYGIVAKIMVAAAEESEESTPPWWEAEVIATERRSLDVAVLEIRPLQPYLFTPGQSMAVEVPQRPRIWRYYSPANAPRFDGSLELHVQIVPGGQVSSSLARSLRPGDLIRLGAPIGDQLTLPAHHTDPLLMIAGGTGLAPLRAVIEQLDEQWRTSGSAPDVHLFHGARMPWNLYDNHYLTQLTSRPWFEYTPVVSEDPTYPGSRGLVGAVAAHARRWDGHTALICGSAGMVEHSIGELTAAGMAEEAIRFEEFDIVGMGDVDRAETTTSHEVTPWQ